MHLSGRRRTGGAMLSVGSFAYAPRAWWMVPASADGVLHIHRDYGAAGPVPRVATTRQEVQWATASITSVHRPPNPDLQACLLAFPRAGKCGSRGQEVDRRRRNLLQSGCPTSAFGLCADRGARRMASQRPLLPLRNLYGDAHPTRVHRPANPTRPPGGDRHHPGTHGIVLNTKHHA